MTKEALEAMAHKGKVAGNERCVHYAKAGMKALTQGRDVDAYAYLDKARHEFITSIEELPF